MILLITISTSTQVFIDYIVAFATDRHTIRNLIAKLWVFLPRFRVVNYSSSVSKLYTAVLTGKIITRQTLITPVNIQNIITPALIASNLFSTRSLGLALSSSSRFIRAYCRAKSPSFIVIRVAPKRFYTTLTVFVKSSLLHQYDFSMEIN